jgi:hypothetical protein
MIVSDTVIDAIDEFGAIFGVCGDGDTVTRPVRMIVRIVSTGTISPRNAALSFADKSVLPSGADWSYGLILSGDAPDGMHQTAHITITDSDGAQYRCEQAMPIYNVYDDGARELIAWRLLLRGTQRMRRGK